MENANGTRKYGGCSTSRIRLREDCKGNHPVAFAFPDLLRTGLPDPQPLRPANDDRHVRFCRVLQTCDRRSPIRRRTHAFSGLSPVLGKAILLASQGTPWNMGARILWTLDCQCFVHCDNGVLVDGG